MGLSPRQKANSVNVELAVQHMLVVQKNKGSERQTPTHDVADTEYSSTRFLLGLGLLNPLHMWALTNALGW